eukprot:100431-Alexandrium_andersonii.AAC.2
MRALEAGQASVGLRRTKWMKVGSSGCKGCRSHEGLRAVLEISGRSKFRRLRESMDEVISALGVLASVLDSATLTSKGCAPRLRDGHRAIQSQSVARERGVSARCAATDR